VRERVKSRLRKVEETRKTDDEAVDLAKSGKTEYFCGVVTVNWSVGSTKMDGGGEVTHETVV
jgi:hypothetical protein